MSKKNIISGLGFILFPDKFELNYLFEVSDMAMDDKTGESCPAALRFRLELIKDIPSFKDEKFYGESALGIKENIFKLAGVTSNRVKLLTWNEFCEKGYNKD